MILPPLVFPGERYKKSQYRSYLAESTDNDIPISLLRPVINRIARFLNYDLFIIEGATEKVPIFL
jgi:hypothetical protein